MATMVRQQRQRSLSVGNRLRLGFLSLVALMAVVGVFGLYQMNRLADATVRLYRHPFAVSNAARDVRIDIARMRRSLQNAVLAPDQHGLDAAVQAIEQSEQQVYAAIGLIRERFLGDHRDLDAAMQTFEHWKLVRDEVIALMRAGQPEAAGALAQGAGQQLPERLEQEFRHVTDFAGNKAEEFRNTAAADARLAYGLTLGVLAAAMAVGLAIAARLTRRIVPPLQVAVQVANQVAEGNVDVRFEVTSQDELGQMLTAMGAMIDYIRQAAAVAEGIANQQADVAVTPKSPQDALNHALQRMLANVRAMLADLTRALQETEQQSWLKDGLNQLNAGVLGDLSLQDMCRAAVSFVARYVNAGHAVLYTYDAEAQALRLGGAFALTEHDRTADVYRLGEGVIGQVARDRAPIFLENLRRADQVITTGTVSEAPLNTYTLPLVYHEELYGVLEVALFEPLDAATRRFLDEANPVLATILLSALQRERVHTLLEHSQQAAKEAELAVFEAHNAKEEAQQQSAELQRANAQLEEQQQRLQQQSEELRQINAHLEAQQQDIRAQREGGLEQERLLRQARAELERRAAESASDPRPNIVAEPAAADDGATRTSVAIDLTGKKILVVDDDVKNVFVLASALEECGAMVSEARNGREALETLRTDPDISLVLMDVMMPLMDGYETMQAIRKDPQLKALPIIAITAKSLLEDHMDCIEAGADDYLTKPVDYESLLRMVATWLEKA